MTMANDEQAEFWSAMAPTWAELEDRLEEVAGPPGRMAMEHLVLRPGQRVVDLGCGTGRTTVELASRVSPGGEAVGVDIAAGMLDRGRERAAGLGLANVEFRQADVQVHDLGEGAFDAAYSRFGVMFFKDPVAAFGNVRRAFRPGASLSFVCWQSVFDNEWMLIPGAAAMSVIGGAPPAPSPEEPGPFSLADPSRVVAVLGAAGFDQVEVSPQSDRLEIDEARIPEVARASSRVGFVADALKDADDETRERVVAAIEEAWRARVQDGAVHATRGFHLVSARA